MTWAGGVGWGDAVGGGAVVVRVHNCDLDSGWCRDCDRELWERWPGVPWEVAVHLDVTEDGDPVARELEARSGLPWRAAALLVTDWEWLFTE
jgi:hypothetical protein